MKQNEFINELAKLNIILTKEQEDKLNLYKDYLKEYNTHTNLTAITNDEDIYLKHFYDSLTIVKSIDLNKINNLIDIGTGAGFPGMVLKIVYPQLNVTLLDSNNKKIKFLESLSQKLAINVNLVNDRAEKFAINNLNKYDLVTSRAVANLRVLSELSLPLVKKEGYFIALKGNIEEELKLAKDTIEIMGGSIENIINFNLYENNNLRNIIVIKKHQNTLKENLRNYDKIIKNPLVKKI